MEKKSSLLTGIWRHDHETYGTFFQGRITREELIEKMDAVGGNEFRLKLNKNKKPKDEKSPQMWLTIEENIKPQGK